MDAAGVLSDGTRRALMSTLMTGDVSHLKWHGGLAAITDINGYLVPDFNPRLVSPLAALLP